MTVNILRSGNVESGEQILEMAEKHSHPGAKIFVAFDVEYLTFWAAVTIDGEEVLYVGTKERFDEWLVKATSEKWGLGH